ncbi:MAG: thiaminase II [Bacteroidales bacterium]|nr:thiaminase II [Bacteroidales bacterium]
MKETTKTKWSTEALEAALPVREAIKKLPFVTELAAGILPREKFIFYLRQDALYLANYSRVLASIASRLDNQSAAAAFLGFATHGMEVEKALHGSYLAEAGADGAAEATPSCLSYMTLLAAQANAPVEVQAAAILPCFLVYYETGCHIAATAAKENPYSRWIETYADTSFEDSCRVATEICDSLAEAASEDIRKAMTDIFVLATKMEWLFWESAYNLEKWKI